MQRLSPKMLCIHLHVYTVYLYYVVHVHICTCIFKLWYVVCGHTLSDVGWFISEFVTSPSPTCVLAVIPAKGWATSCPNFHHPLNSYWSLALGLNILHSLPFLLLHYTSFVQLDIVYLLLSMNLIKFFSSFLEMIHESM